MMHYIPRAISQRLMRSVQHFPSVVVVGARQVGKSTLIQHLFPEYSYVQFDPYEDVENARKDPELFLDNRKTPLILDEVQYAPEVVSAIKRRIDKNKAPGQYILTGSQQWGVMKQMAESLTGRTVIIQLEPFSLSEIALQPPEHLWIDQMLLNPAAMANHVGYLELPKTTYEQLWRGFLPEAQSLPLDLIQAFHATYQKTYTEKDIRLLSDIPDLHQFTRFVRLAAALTAKEINYSELGRDIGVANTTAKRWMTLLTEIFEWYEIPAFSMNAIKRLSTRPKGYFTDTGQICYSLAISTPSVIPSNPIWGSLFETAVVNDIRKQLLWTGKPYNLFHWRSHSGAECDLIIERDGVYYPIEVKATSSPKGSDTNGISAFRKTYPNLEIAPGLVVCLGKHVFKLNERDYAVPWNIQLL